MLMETCLTLFKQISIYVSKGADLSITPYCLEYGQFPRKLELYSIYPSSIQHSRIVMGKLILKNAYPSLSHSATKIKVSDAMQYKTCQLQGKPQTSLIL